jgi:hypothetical protein
MLARAIRKSASYWAGEYAVVHTYFTGGSRTPQRDVGWITLQMFKEWTGSGVYGKRGVTVNSLIKRAAAQIDKIDAGESIGDLDAISGLLQFAIDEFNHFSILCKAFLKLQPQGRMSIEQMGDMPESRRLVEMRHTWREQPNGDLIVDLTEGGGLGMYFAVGDAFAGVQQRSEVDELITRFAQATITDETEHMAGRFRRALQADLEPEDWEQVEVGLQELFAQKLRERNQQFGEPYSASELERMGANAAAGRAYLQRNLGFLGERLEIPV